MNSFKKILVVIDRILYKYFCNNNLILSENVRIHPKATISKAILSGDIEVSEGVKIIDGVSIQVATSVKIGRYSSLNGPNTDLTAKIYPVEIGAFCSIARNVSFQEYNHKFRKISSYNIGRNIFNERIDFDIDSKGPIIIGNDVWIGTQCVILSGSKIGDGVIIAANSVVNSDIPPYAIAAGSPAKVIGYRFDDEIIIRLLELKWWNWPISKIKQNKVLFENELSMELLNKIGI